MLYGSSFSLASWLYSRYKDLGRLNLFRHLLGLLRTCGQPIDKASTLYGMIKMPTSFILNTLQITSMAVCEIILLIMQKKATYSEFLLVEAMYENVRLFNNVLLL
jgi:hypothetical protein